MGCIHSHDDIRIEKTINGTEVVQYVVDKNRPYAQVLEEEHTRGGLSATTSYVYGDALISAATEGSTHYYHTDGLGSVRHLSDASGALTDSYTYDAYGLLTTSSGTTVNPYLYRGEQYDADLDAYSLRARSYQPGTGRFLTTDPVEGFGMDPVRLHRYIYGNNDPVTMFDPSGKMGISVETQVIAAIVGNVSAIAVGNFTKVGQQAYADFGEYIFPDAFVIGVNGYIGIDVLRILAAVTGIPLPSRVLTYNEMWGGEVLFSVSSGEVALFETRARGAELGWGMAYGGADIYRGMVWNLWNAYNYEGPFHSVNLNFPTDPIFGLNGFGIFFDAKHNFKGAWGLSRSIWSSSKRKKFSVAYSRIDYRNLFGGEPVHYPSEASVVASILTSIYTLNIFFSSHPLGSQLNVAGLLLDTTIWVQTGFAKYYWSKTMPQYSLEERQQTRKKRPEHFQSGPGLFAVGSYL